MHCLRQGLQWETELKFKKLFADIARFGKTAVSDYQKHTGDGEITVTY